MTKLKDNFSTLIMTFIITFILSIVANIVGYGYSIMESVPGLLILTAISIVGYILSYVVPIEKISAVLWISIIAILVASPISPIADFVIFHVGNIALMAVVTPILAYAGVLVAQDWDAFLEIGLKGVIVSVFVVAGTFLISSLLGDLFMLIF